MRIKFEFSLILLVIIAQGMSFSQVELKSNYHYSGGFYTSDLFLMEDSTFAYERGGENYSFVTIGTYRISNDSVKLVQFTQGEINAIDSFEFILTPNHSDTIDIDIYCLNGKTVGSNYDIVPLEIAKKWVTSDSVELYKHSSISFGKKSYDGDIAVCFSGFARISGEKEFIEILDNASRLIIHTSLPFEMMQMNSVYESNYKLIDEKKLVFDKVTFYIDQ